MTVLDPHLHDGVPLTVAARRAGVPLRTARRWLAAYQADGGSRIEPVGPGRSRRPADAGVRCVELIEGMALRRPPPRVAEVHRAVGSDRRGSGLADAVLPRSSGGSSPASTAGLVALAHHGPDVYRDDFELVLRRESAHANDIWQADHTELDVMVLDATGSPARPWLTVILDDHSRAIAGYTVFLGDPTAVQTALALRQAIWRKTDPAWPVCGLPATLYSDHGGDFTSDHIAPGVRRREGAADPQSRRANPAAAGRSNGSSAPSPPSCCRPCPGTSRRATTANPSPRRR